MHSWPINSFVDDVMLFLFGLGTRGRIGASSSFDERLGISKTFDGLFSCSDGLGSVK